MIGQSRRKTIAQLIVNIHWIAIGIWIFHVGSISSPYQLSDIFTGRQGAVSGTFRCIQLIAVPVALNLLLSTGVKNSSVQLLVFWLVIHIFITIVGYGYLAIKACQGALENIHLFGLIPLVWLTLCLRLVQNLWFDIIIEKLPAFPPRPPITDETEKSGGSETTSSVYSV